MELLEIKAAIDVDAEGAITGMAWPFAEPDRAGDIITKGAFNIPEGEIPMLLGHNPEHPIGVWTDVHETDTGLEVKGRLLIGESTTARSVRSMVRSGLISGLSIAFRNRASFKNGRNRVISALDLLEISVVRTPSHPKARIASAKDATAAFAEAIHRAASALRKPLKV